MPGTSLAGTSAAGTSAAAQKRAEVATRFEAVFLTETVQQMLKEAGTGAIGSSDAEKTWNGFLAEAIAGKIAESRTTGIAQSIERMLGAYGETEGGGET
ncbi:rod-binding protein [Frigidibacter sp. MR17.24]